MESLNVLASPLDQSRWQKAAQLFVIVFFAVIIVAPVLYALARLSLQVDTESLTPLFFWILVRSFFFSFLQSFASIFSIFFVATAIGALYLAVGLPRSLRSFLQFLAPVSFSLSATLQALFVVYTFSLFTQNVPYGLGLIVCCHALLNVPFIALSLIRRIDKLRTNCGNELLLYFRSLGAQKNYFFFILKEALFIELRLWGPLLFLWCLMSFAPVLILGKAPFQSSPEVLLYTSLLTDPSGARILVLFAAILLISLLAARFHKSTRFTEELESTQAAPALLKYPAYVSFLGGLFFLLPFCLPYFLMLKNSAADFFSPRRFSFAELAPAFLGSLKILALSYVIATVLAHALLLCSSSFRKRLSFFYFFTPPIILLGWMEVLGDFTSFGFLLVALGVVLSQTPWLASQLHSEASAIPKELVLLSKSWGTTPFQYWRHILYPQCSSRVRLLIGTFMAWTIGDFAFSKALLDNNSTLTLAADEALRRYNFSLSSQLLCVIFLSSVLICFLSEKKVRQRARV